jgi:hypothetical protein
MNYIHPTIFLANSTRRPVPRVIPPQNSAGFSLGARPKEPRPPHARRDTTGTPVAGTPVAAAAGHFRKPATVSERGPLNFSGSSRRAGFSPYRGELEGKISKGEVRGLKFPHTGSVDGDGSSCPHTCRSLHPSGTAQSGGLLTFANPAADAQVLPEPRAARPPREVEGI